MLRLDIAAGFASRMVHVCRNTLEAQLSLVQETAMVLYVTLSLTALPTVLWNRFRLSIVRSLIFAEISRKIEKLAKNLTLRVSAEKEKVELMCAIICVCARVLKDSSIDAAIGPAPPPQYGGLHCSTGVGGANLSVILIT
ncbi:uncharacterized protein TNCV_3891351 [Trichonephila clavipes]|nr:uncharacterized protein TNCV_3891351 [Trichonephila clavipes]